MEIKVGYNINNKDLRLFFKNRTAWSYAVYSMNRFNGWSDKRGRGEPSYKPPHSHNPTRQNQLVV